MRVSISNAPLIGEPHCLNIDKHVISLYHNDHNHIKCHTQTPVIISATPLLYRKAEILVISLHGKAKLSSRLTVSRV